MISEEILFHDGACSILIGDFHSFFHRTFYERFDSFLSLVRVILGDIVKNGLNIFVFLFAEVKNEVEDKKKQHHRFSRF
ncbi:hypothetical protein [Enterococcus sp. DIV2469a]|uniref:hypothetical protein n=1 Tax=Enterococcus sp. DIV2469a TaxID=2774667 RepID=UPI003F6872CC